MEANGYDPAKRYSQEEIDELVAKSPYYKATSNDVDWLMKVKMGRPLYQRNHQPAERCRRGSCQPPVCRSMEIRLQRMYGIPRRLTFRSIDFNQIG